MRFIHARLHEAITGAQPEALFEALAAGADPFARLDGHTAWDRALDSDLLLKFLGRAPPYTDLGLQMRRAIQRMANCAPADGAQACDAWRLRRKAWETAAFFEAFQTAVGVRLADAGWADAYGARQFQEHGWVRGSRWLDAELARALARFDPTNVAPETRRLLDRHRRTEGLTDEISAGAIRYAAQRVAALCTIGREGGVGLPSAEVMASWRPNPSDGPASLEMGPPQPSRRRAMH